MRIPTMIAVIACLTATGLAQRGEDVQPEAPPAEAADAKPADDAEPAADQPADGAMTATVVSVSGPAQKLVAVEEGAEPQWRPIEEGDELGELTIIRTGLGGTVVLQFADRGRVTVNSATKAGISEFRKEGDTARARVGLKYGTVDAKVDREAGRNDFRVATPVAVASIRGTSGQVGYSGDMGMGLNGETGTWNLNTPQGRMQVFAGEFSNDNLIPPMEHLLNQRDPGLGDVFGGLTDTEQRNLRDNGGGRGIVGFTGGGAENIVLDRPVLPNPVRQDYEY